MKALKMLDSGVEESIVGSSPFKYNLHFMHNAPALPMG